MSMLLHIAASPNSKEISESLRLADAFLETYRVVHPDVSIDTLNLWSEPLIPFDGVKVGAKAAIAGGGVPAGAQAEAWSEIVATFNRFNAAESYLFSVPMWNAGIPYVLKHYIDIITQPGLLFRLDPRLGYTGLLTGKKAAVIYTSAIYGPGASPAFGRDFHSTYFDDWLRFIGISDITTIRFQPTMLTPDAVGARAAATAQAHEVAKMFGSPAPTIRA